MKRFATVSWNVFVQHHKKLLFVIFTSLALVISLIMLAYSRIQHYQQYVYNSVSELQAAIGDQPATTIVLGAGINYGAPTPILSQRLDKAAELIQTPQFSKLLLSGDNRFLNYNEPASMETYMIEKYHVDPAHINVDYAGRSTYETCERAKKVFGQQRIVLVSQSSHLIRAIYLCRSFGLEAYGLSANPNQPNNRGQLWRELFARVKAIYNVHIKGEDTVFGPPITLR